jgi:hypothetical protein
MSSSKLEIEVDIKIKNEDCCICSYGMFQMHQYKQSIRQTRVFEPQNM